MLRRCRRCGEKKGLSEFGLYNNGDGPRRRFVCKACCYEDQKRWLGKNRDKLRKYHRDWKRNARTNPEFCKAERISHLKSSYGIDDLTVKKQLIVQNASCAICGELFTVDNFYCIDHDHSTGEFRGLLCHSCNVMLGKFETSGFIPKHYTKVQQYLRR